MTNQTIHNVLALCILASSLMSCQTAGEKIEDQYRLTAEEKTICNNIGFDTNIIKEIRKYNFDKIEQFHYSLGKTIEKDTVIEEDPILLKGLVFSEHNSRSYETVFNLKPGFAQKGYYIFLLETDYNFKRNVDRIGVLKTTDKYTVLKQVATDGINYGITNDSLLTIIKNFDSKYSLELIGASGDWCEFIIHKEPDNWNKFAEEVYTICPDAVEQGAGSINKLAETMKTSKRLYLWWD